MLRNIREHKFFLLTFSVCALLLICSIFAIFVKIGDLTTPIIIHFDAYKGIDFLGTKLDAYGIIITGLIALILNAFLVDILYRREKLVSYIVVFATIVLTCLIFIGVSVIIGNN